MGQVKNMAKLCLSNLMVDVTPFELEIHATVIEEEIAHLMGSPGHENVGSFVCRK